MVELLRLAGLLSLLCGTATAACLAASLAAAVSAGRVSDAAASGAAVA
jgi:hypothetical protein